MNKKEILIITSTHGDEKIGSEIVTALGLKKMDVYFDELVANPKSAGKNRRFIDFDLNRAYPGKITSQYYEKRQAVKNLKIAKKYKYIIDIHEASCGTDDFIIIPREEIGANFPVEKINLKKVLLWPNPKGPLSQVLNNAIELEFGMKGRRREMIVAKATDIMATFIKETVENKKTRRKKEIYYVYGEFREKDKMKYKNLALKDFRLVKTGEEIFYPLLVGQYLTEGIICYKMKKIGF